MNLKQIDLDGQTERQFIVVQQSVNLPISVEEFEAWNKITQLSERNIAENCIRAAQDYLEQFIGSSIMNRSMKALFKYPSRLVYLPFTARAISKVYIEEDGDFDYYSIEGLSDLYLNLTSVPEKIQVEYFSGYVNATDIPASIRLAVAKIALELFENRGDSNSVNVDVISGGTWLEVRRLVRPYKRNLL